MSEIDLKLDKCMQTIYEVRLMCLDIIMDLKELKKRPIQQTTSSQRIAGQDAKP